MRRTIATWISLLALCACAEPEENIIGECAVAGDVVTVPLADGERVTAVGVIGSHTLLTSVRSIAPSEDGERRVAIRSRSLDGSFAQVGDPVAMGIWRDVPAAGRMRWVRVEDALVGQVLADPDPEATLEHDVELVHVWTMRPPPDARAEGARVEMRAMTRPGTAELWVSGFVQAAFDEAVEPAAMLDGRFAAASWGLRRAASATSSGRSCSRVARRTAGGETPCSALDRRAAVAVC